MVRQPAVAGRFYPGTNQALRAELRSLIAAVPSKRKVIGILSPHAGYMYSGKAAGEVYGSIDIPRTVVILGPNHTGIGAPCSVFAEGDWATPLGTVPVDVSLARAILDRLSGATADTAAHLHEHSLEVQVPFLQYLREDLRIVPLCLGFGDYSSCRSVGEAVADAVSASGDDVLIVASSDMTHYEPAAAAKAKDDLALGRFLDLDPEGLLAVCRREGITMCGVVAATVMLVAALRLGATTARLVTYTNSGEASGDYTHVVAYAAAMVE